MYTGGRCKISSYYCIRAKPFHSDSKLTTQQQWSHKIYHEFVTFNTFGKINVK